MPLPSTRARLVLVFAALAGALGSLTAACGASPVPGAPDAGPVDPVGADPDSGASPADGAGPDAFAACPADRSDGGDFPADVAAVLAAKCQTCHEVPPKDRAPFALLTYADTQAPDPLAPYTGVPIWQVMHVVIQPGGDPHMPFSSAPQLTAAEMATLDGWLLACALPQ